MINKKEGRKIAIVAVTAPCQPKLAIPMNDAKVNKGPGTAWAAPYPAKN